MRKGKDMNAERAGQGSARLRLAGLGFAWLDQAQLRWASLTPCHQKTVCSATFCDVTS